MRQKLLIGRKDKADFPEFKLENLEVKIDSGAYTSSIHCHLIEEQIKNGVSVICFQLLDPRHPGFHGKKFESSRFKTKRVKSSNGQKEERYIIKTEIILFGKTYSVELSLAERGSMKTPVLLGRKLLNKNFLIDTSRKNLSYKQKIKKEENI